MNSRHTKCCFSFTISFTNCKQIALKRRVFFFVCRWKLLSAFPWCWYCFIFLQCSCSLDGWYTPKYTLTVTKHITIYRRTKIVKGFSHSGKHIKSLLLLCCRLRCTELSVNGVHACIKARDCGATISEMCKVNARTPLPPWPPPQYGTNSKYSIKFNIHFINI